MSDYGLAIFDQHQALLRESAITPDVARQRGYVSVDQKTRLERVGFSPVQRRVPGLLIPVHGVTGEIVAHEYRPDVPRVTEAGKTRKYEKPYGASNRLDVPPAVLPILPDPAVQLWITEGARKVDAAVSADLACVGLSGVYGWRYKDPETGGKVALADFESVALNDREVVLAFDSDVITKPDVREALRRLRTFLESRGAHTLVCMLPTTDGKVGLDDYLAAGNTREELESITVQHIPDTTDDDDTPPPPKDLPVSDTPVGTALAECLATYRKWLHIESDDQVIAALAAAAANVLPGDPFWILFVSAPGSGKTETIQPLAVLPYVHPAASFTEASLLSGVEKKQVAKDATGGLLRQIGEFGVFLCKDFSGVLSMNRDARAAALAALREVYDGSWHRPVGTDGGKVLDWKGKAGLIGAATTSIDRHHAVMGTLGERFVLYRLTIDEPDKQGNRRIHNRRHEITMRAELAEAVTGIMASLNRDYDRDLTDTEIDLLVKLANYVTWARTAVERDGYSRDIEVMPEREMPGRLAGQLATYLIAIEAVTDGDTTTAWRIIHKVALDCLPALRRTILDHLHHDPKPQRIGDITTAVKAPRTTVERTLEDLTLLGIVKREKSGEHDTAAWQYQLTSDGRTLYPATPETSNTPRTTNDTQPSDPETLMKTRGSYIPLRAFDDISGVVETDPATLLENELNAKTVTDDYDYEPTGPPPGDEDER
jgi:DNA-binding HxlR family transcriptional regulator